MEGDEIILVDVAVFEKIKQSSCRVYILKFSTDIKKFFQMKVVFTRLIDIMWPISQSHFHVSHLY